jgi:hypothetical protein
MSDARVRVRNSDLPAGTTDRFAKDVLQIVHDTSGALLPWEFPTDEQIIEIWNLVFEDEYPILDGAKDELFPIIKGLVYYTSPIACSPLIQTYTDKAWTLGVAP